VTPSTHQRIRLGVGGAAEEGAVNALTRLFGTKEEREARREARRRAAEQVERERLATHLRRLQEESFHLSAELIQRYQTGRLGAGADRTAIKAIATDIQRCGQVAVAPLCTLVAEECPRNEALIYAAQEAMEVLANLGDGSAVAPIVQGAVHVGAVRDDARAALRKLAGEAAVDLLEKKIAARRA
jgi:hypothetical protein